MRFTRTSYKRNCLLCSSKSSHNYPGQRPLYCSKHAKFGMIDIFENRLCAHKDCGRIATHATRWYNPPIYCIIHKLFNMVDVTYGYRCEECNSYACYGNIDDIPRRCINHRLKGMNDLFHYTACFECDILASYGTSTRQKVYCSSHTKPGMINPSQQLNRLKWVSPNGITQVIYSSNKRKSVVIDIEQDKGQDKRMKINNILN
jgi:hypothetical protein